MSPASERLVLIVEDTGAGGGAVLGEPAETERGIGGYGLRHARDRLEQLYGDEASLQLKPASDGGMTAEIRLPLRVASLVSARDEVMVGESGHA